MRVCAMAACAVVAAGMVLTGCGPAAPATSGTPTVVGTGPTAAATPLCTPESGGSATPCTQEQYEEMKKLDALYAEAEDVYRRFVAEDERISRDGSLATDEFKRLVAGELATEGETLYRQRHEEGVKAVGGEFVIKYVRRAPNQSYEGSLVALSACVDGTTASFEQNGKPVGKGSAISTTSFYKRFDGTLKLFKLDGRISTSCVG